jgi:hypothetical protein
MESMSESAHEFRANETQTLTNLSTDTVGFRIAMKLEKSVRCNAGGSFAT